MALAAQKVSVTQTVEHGARDAKVIGLIPMQCNYQNVCLEY